MKSINLASYGFVRLVETFCFHIILKKSSQEQGFQKWPNLLCFEKA